MITAIGLGGSSDHVLDEITMSRGVDDGDVVLGSLELPEGDIDGDTTLTLSLQLVQNPGVLERSPCPSLGLPSRTSRWYACRCHHIGRSSDRWWWTCRSRRVQSRQC